MEKTPINKMDSVICTVDVVMLTVQQDQLQVLLVQREQAPFAHAWALPGGFIHASDLDAAAAARRVLQEKAGINAPYLEQLATFSGQERDPRGWSVSIVYYALVSTQLLTQSSIGSLQLTALSALPALPFDHADIIHTASDRLRSKSQYSSLPCYLLGETFTLPELQKVYEIVIGESLNKSDFRRKLREMDALEEVEGLMQKGGAHRPSQVYRLKPELLALKIRKRGI